MSVPLRRSLAIGLACSALFAGVAHAAGSIRAVGVENEYANVISQIGGEYVQVRAIESNPNTDPHTFEASPAIAREMAAAQLVVRNGLGYDTWAKKILAANPSQARKVIVVQDLLGLPENTRNPHLWYKPETMPKVAAAVADALSSMMPEHRAYFAARVKRFDASLRPWYEGLAAFKKQYPNTPVAVTEPVADYMLEAAGCEIKTPWSLQAAIMNGTDPAPQDVSKQNALLGQRQVKVFLYNQQVTDSLTQSFLATAKQAKVPVVGVYETMPTGYDYQRWMMAELNALRAAVSKGTSTTVLH
ncbi:zinc ABC transporter substrate-binding protein [Acidithiobacillus sp. IBUN Pt1247-S3]|uniref:metal ABC transporter solute-binding protein, Zn/Mn family n=1 Tax=Acidithiobacillus sp. IBUN Pt1247-S3 TaxID=3166642 RepID=UPI0034E3A7CC